MTNSRPQVREQAERVKKPAVMFLIGMALAGPAGAFMIGTDTASSRADRTAMTTVPALVDATVAREALTESLAKMFNVPMELATEIYAAAERENITPRIAFGLVKAESRFKATAISPVGAIGLTQLMPGTAKWLDPSVERKDLFKPETNLRVGFGYLRKLMDTYNGDVRLALTAYNRGPGAVRKSVRHGENPDNGYADLVLRDASLPKTKMMTAHTSTGGRTSLIRAKMAGKTSSKPSVTRSSKAKTFKVASIRRSSVKAAAVKKATVKKATVKKATVKKATVKKAPAKKMVKKAVASKKSAKPPAPPNISIPEPKI